MALTAAQLQALKAAIAADPVLAAYPATADGNYAVAGAFNLVAAPDYYVWRTDAPVDSILDAITWSNYTPQDTPDNTVTYQNRAMLCQTKQINLQLLLQGRELFNAAKPTLRGGLNDATTNIPSGAAGVSRSGGWTAILPLLRRLATRAEKLFSVAGSGVGNNGANPRGDSSNPDVMAFEGFITEGDVAQARNA